MQNTLTQLATMVEGIQLQLTQAMKHSEQETGKSENSTNKGPYQYSSPKSTLNLQSTNPMSSVKPPKLSLPPFDGSNPLDWIFQAELYFNYYQLPPEDRLSTISFYMQGQALSWFMWMYNNQQLTTWDAFVRDLEMRFGPSSYDNHRAALFKLRQTESKLRDRRARSNPGSIFPFNPNTPPTQNQPNKTPVPLLPSPPSINMPPVRRLTRAEAAERRLKGLCYNCKEKYGPGHICKGPQFLLLVVDEEEQSDIQHPELPQSVPHNQAQCHTITDSEFYLSLAAYFGLSSPKTLRVSGEIQGQVMVGNGEMIKCQGKCANVKVHIQGCCFEISFLVLPIQGADLVLGVEWLSSLGRFVSDYSIPSSVMTMHAIIYKTNPPSSILANQNSNTNYLPLDTLLTEFNTIFQPPTELPPSRNPDHHIHLTSDSKPVNVKPYRYPHYQKTIMTELIQNMLKDGIIRPSHSLYSSPVLLVQKRDRTWRFCVDYRALNAITIKNRFPISTVDELLDELHGATVFSKIDLRSGYHQIRVAAEDIQKIAFRTVDGHYEFVIMPFGLSNGPSTFQAAMNDLFREVLRHFVLVFFDDILIYSATLKEHVEHLRQIFTILKSHQYYAKLSKCVFSVATVHYLGHIISGDGVRVDPEKIQAIMEWPKPTTVSALQGFLGLTGYYSHFVRQYAGIASPLSDLLKSQQFRWNERAEVAFKDLKDAMTQVLVLALPDFMATFELTTDASGTAIGAVLSQYLLGRKFFIFTDQQSLKYLMSQSVQTPEQHKWLTKLMGYDYEIIYKPGKENKVADALSRVQTCSYAAITAPEFTWLSSLREYFATEPKGMDFLQKTSIQVLQYMTVKFISSMAFLKPSFRTETLFSYLSFRRNCFASLAPNSTTATPTTLSLMANQRPSQKLAPRFFGPYRILRRIGNVAYEINLPATSRIHNIFHISRLHRCLDNPPEPTFPIPTKDEDDRPISNTAPTDCTWEDVEELRCSHPSLFSDTDPSGSVGMDDSSLVDKAKCKNDEEIVAVIAHELGHWKLNHTMYSFIAVHILTSFQFGGYTLVRNSTDLFQSFGFDTQPVLIGLIIFQHTVIPFQHLVSFGLDLVSRSFEFQADAFAKKLGYGPSLRACLVKLQESLSAMKRIGGTLRITILILCSSEDRLHLAKWRRRKSNRVAWPPQVLTGSGTWAKEGTLGQKASSMGRN
ncbi:hypothetical protein F3Y22_tig00112528pilonHSYRG00009 [Hibiscus syriacus]|uniref:Reverse transcriptase domain-containing protein n=1 Tax=Hibiscus syriacus TaxID=106335 RepID=A0A6A2XF36_HIBSY|nr:hypothetical protein F3Y22_tig00112528pilonHSYRG00009 [Hibiscus syriacus]